MRHSITAAAVLILAATAARAAKVDASSTTLLLGRPSWADGSVKTIVPLYELVGVRASGVENPWFDDLRINLSAWGSLDATLSTKAPVTGDVDLAFAEGRLLKRRLRLRLGRQFVIGGAARTSYLDGLAAEYRLSSGAGASAFFGRPVERRFDNIAAAGDFATGGRLFWAPSFNTEVGVSFIHVAKAGATARQDVGLDGRWAPLNSVLLAGAAVVSLAEMRLAEVDFGPRWHATDDLELSVDVRRVAPDLMLSRSSIFSVFADNERDDVGASLFYRLCSRLSVFGDYRALWLSGEPGTDAGLRFQWRAGRFSRTTLTAQARLLKVPDNGFLQGRLAASHRVRDIGLSADLESYCLDKPIRGQNASFHAGLTASWFFARKWMLGISAFGATTPDFESRFEAMAKLSYAFASPSRAN